MRSENPREEFRNSLLSKRRDSISEGMCTDPSSRRLIDKSFLSEHRESNSSLLNQALSKQVTTSTEEPTLRVYTTGEHSPLPPPHLSTLIIPQSRTINQQFNQHFSQGTASDNTTTTLHQTTQSNDEDDSNSDYSDISYDELPNFKNDNNAARNVVDACLPIPKKIVSTVAKIAVINARSVD